MTSPSRQFWMGEHMALIDEEDYPIVSRFTWHAAKSKQTYYAHTSVKIGGKTHGLSMHRLLTGMVSSDIDHVNRNGLDNRKSNLRFATKQQNSFNRVRKNQTGYRGVKTFHGKTKTYWFQIQKDKTRISKYGFKTPEEAARAYDKACRELHGEFGITNFKD